MALLLLGPVAGPRAGAYETDQYSNRLEEISDSRELLNGRVNAALEEIVAGWQGPRDDLRFARCLYWKIGGLHWVDHIERWAMKSSQVEKLPQRRHRSVFSGAPFFAARVNAVFGIGRTLKVAGVLIGSDKLGHFVSQGVKYFGRHQAGWSEEKLLHLGWRRERMIFGQLTTGVFSNADLVANYEGYLFYQSLFEDGIVAGKGAIVGWQGDRPQILRPFDWADHVNDYWDEALNPSFLSPGLQRWMDKTLPSLCPDFRQDPEAFYPNNGTALAQRYAHLGLKAALWNRLDQVCGEEPAAAAR